MKFPPQFPSFALAGAALFGVAAASCAQQNAPAADKPAAPSLRLGQKITIEGQPYFFLRKEGERLVFTPPPTPMEAKLGAFITPKTATASSVQSGTPRSLTKTIDGSGLSESFPGSGVYVHSSNIFADGENMWNSDGGDAQSTLLYDLGQTRNVAGIYLWNYNEGSGQYSSRGINEMEVFASTDGRNFTSLGKFKVKRAPGNGDYAGQTIAFDKPVKASHVRIKVLSNFGDGQTGLAEIRFANADVPYQPPQPFQPKYARPTYPKLALGAPAPNAKNYPLPAGYGHADVTDPKYGAKGDGITDDTAAIQKALNENSGGIIYLPNGRYLVSDTLKWPGSNPTGPRDWKYTALQGQSREGAIIMLRDNAPGYDNPGKAKPVIWTGLAPAQRFANEVFNLTVDTGTGNIGAAGLHFVANNSGSIKNVAVVSGDGQGVAGIDFGYTGENGPLLVKDVRVKGFDVGIATAESVNSQTLENIALEDQNVAGLRNSGQVMSIRNLTSRNSVAALALESGLVALDGATLTGTGDANGVAAITNNSSLLARNVTATGYARAIENRAGGGASPAGLKVTSFEVPSPQTRFGVASPLNLPVKETPDAPHDAPADWVSIRDYLKDGVSASDALQAAIDAGKSTVFLPGGGYPMTKTVVIRGNVRRIVGEKAWLDTTPEFRNSGTPMFRLEDGASPTVWIERLNTDFEGGNHRFLDHESKRTLVLRHMALNLHSSKTGTGYRAGAGAGDLFLEDVVGPGWEFRNQNVWARQFNAEINGTHIANDNSKVWILGLKTERPGTIVATKGGGQTEVMGGLIYNIGGGKDAPMFTVEGGGKLAAFVAETHFADSPYQQFVVETRDGKREEYGVQGEFKGQRAVVYRSGK